MDAKAVGLGQGRGPHTGLPLGEKLCPGLLVFRLGQIVPLGEHLKEQVIGSESIRIIGEELELQGCNGLFVPFYGRYGAPYRFGILGHFNEGVNIICGVYFHDLGFRIDLFPRVGHRSKSPSLYPVKLRRFSFARSGFEADRENDRNPSSVQEHKTGILQAQVVEVGQVIVDALG